MPDRPRSRRPDSWPPRIIQAILRATEEEVCIPFENETAVELFKRVVLDIRRSFREHKHPRAEDVNALRSMTANTSDMILTRPRYQADPDEFPFTIVLSPALGFLRNLEEASISPTKPIPDVEEVPTSASQLLTDLAEVMEEQARAEESDPNELAEYFRARRDK